MTLAADGRQRAADVVAVMVLASMNILEVPADLDRLASIVAEFCALQSPDTLQTYSAMGWEKAVEEIKIACARYYLAGRPAGPDEVLPPDVDRQIGNCLIAAFFKFITFRGISPGWYASHIDGMRLAGGPAAGG